MFSKLGTLLSTFLVGTKVGNDKYGNNYYSLRNGKNRWVIYYKNNDASSVPPEWQAWLTRTNNNIPKSDKLKYNWQIEHTPNATGSIKAIKGNNKVQKIYNAWNPKNSKGTKID